ncbi:MAG: serine protease [Pseudorhodoplanes sp.]
MSLPAAERLAIQSDLVWSGDLIGGLDPEFGDRAIAAVRSFQKRNKFDDTGILTPEQRQTLAGAMRTRKDYNGWRLVEDTMNPGVRLGIPAKLVPVVEAGQTGSRWTAARGEIQIETFREKMAGSQLSELFEEMKRRPSGRRTETSSLGAASFSIAGMQGLKRFHVRAYLKDNEARGLTILFDQAMEGIMLPMVDTITNSFLPFGDPNSASSSRKVEYGSGFVVSEQGHVVTERQLTDNCQGIIVAGLGRADRLSEDKTSDLALLRVHGAGPLKPIPFSAEPPKSTDLTLVGIPDPEAQAGARHVTTSNARLRGVDGVRVLLDTTPARGFIGGVALDGQGQLVGMIDLAPVVTAGPATAASAAALVPTASIRKFLDGAGVNPMTGKSGVAAAKEAVVRVICVRK